MFKFGGSRPIDFVLVFGGSNMVGLASNLVISFLT